MFTLNCKGKLVTIERPLVMGIINATPDSFYADSRFEGKDEILRQAEKMNNEKVDIIDIGGQSTRPGSKPISVAEELERVMQGIEAIHSYFPGLLISIDTFNSAVAKEAILAGASIVNDVSAGTIDKDMIPTVAQLGAPYIAMHIKGTPETMQHQAQYENVTLEVLDYFIRKKHECNSAGINDLIIDPGFGFAKSIAHNFELLRNLSVLKMLDRPIMIGISRKSSVYKTLGVPQHDALNGTTVLNTIALLNGASILRVHDVKQAKEVVELCSWFI